MGLLVDGVDDQYQCRRRGGENEWKHGRRAEKAGAGVWGTGLGELLDVLVLMYVADLWCFTAFYCMP